MKKVQVIKEIQKFLKEYENSMLDYQVAAKLFEMLDKENLIKYDDKKPRVEIDPKILLAVAKADVKRSQSDENHSMDLKPALKQVADEIKDHFKKNSWDLDARFYSASLAQKFMGVDPMSLLVVEVSKVADLHFTDKGVVFRKKTKKKAKK